MFSNRKSFQLPMVNFNKYLDTDAQ